jgi:hypothetical protein
MPSIYSFPLYGADERRRLEFRRLTGFDGLRSIARAQDRQTSVHPPWPWKENWITLWAAVAGVR